MNFQETPGKIGRVGMSECGSFLERPNEQKL
jgi:hypothetical protein